MATAYDNRPPSKPPVKSPIFIEDLGVSLASGATEDYEVGRRKKVEVSASAGEVTIHFLDDEGEFVPPSATAQPGDPFEYDFHIRGTYPAGVQIEANVDSEYSIRVLNV